MNIMLQARKKLEYEKAKLQILKNNFHSFMDKNSFMEKFPIEKGFDITQNVYSLPLIFNAIFFPDARSYFFLELFNLFQDLEINVPYTSYSQSFTTYCLKLLARNHFIEIISCPKLEEQEKTFDLSSYKNTIDTSIYWDDTYYTTMYEVNFAKQYSFTKEDLPFIFKIASSLGIDPKLYRIVLKDGKMYLRLRRKVLAYQIASGQTGKKLKVQLGAFSAIIEDSLYRIFNFKSLENIAEENELSLNRKPK